MKTLALVSSAQLRFFFRLCVLVCFMSYPRQFFFDMWKSIQIVSNFSSRENQKALGNGYELYHLFCHLHLLFSSFSKTNEIFILNDSLLFKTFIPAIRFILRCQTVKRQHLTFYLPKRDHVRKKKDLSMGQSLIFGNKFTKFPKKIPKVLGILGKLFQNIKLW